MCARHEILKGKISDSAYNLLDWLFSNKQQMESGLFDKVRNDLDICYVVTSKLQNDDLKLKKEILYLRYCNLIENLCKEYEELNIPDKKEIIDYYIFDNRLKELNFLGIGFYYDCKFKRKKVTVYKGRFKETNWNQVCNSEKVKNKVGVDAIKEIFKVCREHINPGGSIQLRSFSKCFIIDLFKYISLYTNKDGIIAADIYVKKDADINVIEIDNKPISLQKYITSRSRLEDSKFVIDFSEPRNYNRDNFYRWYKDFMGAEFNDVKNEGTIETEQKSYEEYISEYFSRIIEHSENRKQVSLMVSPVADREVVVSGDLWETIDYDEEEKNTDACIHFSLNEEELYELIISYFIRYLNLGEGVNAVDISKKFRTNLVKMLDLLKKELNKENGVDGGEELCNKINCIKQLIESSSENKKVLAVLAMIDWDCEKKYWNEDNVKKLSYSRIYNKSKENLFVNVLKCICIDIIKGM